MHDFVLTAHAETVIFSRSISREWISRVLNNPQRIEQDKSDPELRHALGCVPERENRVLRVVYNDAVHPRRVVTAYFDRSQKDKL